MELEGDVCTFHSTCFVRSNLIRHHEEVMRLFKHVYYRREYQKYKTCNYIKRNKKYKTCNYIKRCQNLKTCNYIKRSQISVFIQLYMCNVHFRTIKHELCSYTCAVVYEGHMYMGNQSWKTTGFWTHWLLVYCLVCRLVLVMYIALLEIGARVGCLERYKSTIIRRYVTLSA